jgi:transposase
MNETLFELPPTEPPATAEAGTGKPRLVRPNRGQVAMHLAALDDLLPAEHLARVIWGLVEPLDLSALYAPIRAVDGHAGHPAIDPAVLVALWLYATAEGVGSARALDRLCREHLAYQWLCGGVSVNYHTLADFRVTHERALDALLTQQVAALMAAGLVSLARTAQDGVRIRASAGSSSFRRRARLEQFQAEAQARVEQLKTQAGTDDAQHTARQQAAQARAARERLARVQQALQELVQLEQTQAKSHQKKSKRKPPRSSTSDPQARVMQMPDGGHRPAYNGQVAVDTASGLIVGVDVTNQIDRGQLEPMRQQLQARYGRSPHEHLVDGGFVAHADIEASATAGVTLYAPLPATRATAPPAEQSRSKAGPGVRAWWARMETDAAKAIYKLRAQTVEWANAGLRQRGLYQVRVRGQAKVRAVLLWFALIHNLLRGRALQATATAASG